MTNTPLLNKEEVLEQEKIKVINSLTAAQKKVEKLQEKATSKRDQNKIIEVQKHYETLINRITKL